MKNFNAENNRAVWFDIPVTDLDRAKDFYEAVLNIEVFKEKADEFEFCVLDHKDGNGGCLFINKDEISSNSGIILYLNVNGRIKDAVVKAEKKGAKILKPIHQIGEHGFRSVILDSEGNRIVLHSDTDE
jgi:uncharacterized protein